MNNDESEVDQNWAKPYRDHTTLDPYRLTYFVLIFCQVGGASVDQW